MDNERKMPLLNRNVGPNVIKVNPDIVIKELTDVLKKHGVDTNTGIMILYSLLTGLIQQDTINKALFTLQQMNNRRKENEKTMDGRSND